MLARFFVDRPIFAWVISIVITFVGGVAAFMLPVAQYPDITPPTVQVSAMYPGANAQVVADSVAAPIEQQISGVDHMLYMSSQCTNDGAYNLTVTFDLGTDPNMNQVLVQNRVSLAMSQLPNQVQIQGVTTKKRSPSILLVVNLISPDGSYDNVYLSNYATIQIKDELLRLPGVGDLTYLGQRDYSMRVWLDPDKMATLNLTTNDVVNAVSNQNIQVAAGQIGQQPVPEGQQFQFTMSTLGRLTEESQFADIIIKTGQGTAEQGSPSSQIVRLKDVARIELAAQQYDQIARLDGQPSVGLALFLLPGANALNTADGIRKKMEELKTRFPRGVDYRIVYDTTPFITQSIEEVFKTLRDAIVLVAIVVLLFLQDWKAMILPMIDVPVALIGTFAVMAAIGFSLNNLTLFGLVLAIGIVVDDAIMVLENIERLIATGLDPKTATIKAMDELTGPILAITLVLCSVFLPSAFIPGITGEFYRQFAITIAASMIISAINAMTLTPARAVAIFKGGHEGHEHTREALPWWFFGLLAAILFYMLGPQGLAEDLMNRAMPGVQSPPAWLPWLIYTSILLPVIIIGGLLGLVIIKPVNKALSLLFRGFNWLFDKFTALYGWTVGRMLRLSVIVLLLYGGLLFLTGRVMTKAPTGFLPTQDQGYLLVNVQLPDSASVQRTSQIMSRIERMALGDDSGKYHGVPAEAGDKKYPGIPGVAHVVSIAGQSFLLSANGSNYGSAFLTLEPFDKRHSHEEYDAVIAEKFRVLATEDIEGAVVSVFRAPPIQGLGNAGGFQFQTEQRGYVDLDDLQKATDELVAEASKDRRFLGVFTMFRAETPQIYLDIDRAKCESLQVPVQDVFNTLQVYMGGYFVNLFNKFGRTWQVNLMAEPNYRTDVEYLKQLKVRNAKGEMVPLGTLTEVKDIGGPSMVMRYNMYASAAVNGVTLPTVSSGESIEIIDKLAEDLNLPIEWTAITYMQILAGNVAIYVFMIGTLLVYLVLAAKYESWSLPLAVILVVPMCMLCSVTGMLIARLPVDIFVQIGLLVLVGMAAKNAILIVEFADMLHKEGKSLYDATIEACRLRLRPIVMTSFAFILGVVPLVLAEGAGAEMRQSLGTAVFSGMIGVLIFGIFLTPVFFFAIIWWVERRKKPAPVVAAHTEPPPPKAPS